MCYIANTLYTKVAHIQCRQVRAEIAERLRIALLNVDYVTSFELPFRLLLVRAP